MVEQDSVKNEVVIYDAFGVWYWKKVLKMNHQKIKRINEWMKERMHKWMSE